MIITVANIKGGVGKSCTAQNIAVGLAKREYTVLLVDTDPQRTTHDWSVMRQGGRDVKPTYDIKVIFMSAADEKVNIGKELLKFEAEYDVVVVDSGGHDSVAMRYALGVCTHALIPFRPKRRDLNVIYDVSALLKQAANNNKDMKPFALITQCPTLPSQYARILEAKEVCAAEGIPPLNSIIFTRNAYDDSEENGLTVYESGLDEKAIMEVDMVIDELLTK